MTKDIFLTKLHDSLSQLPETEIQKHIQYYEEMISDRIEDGMTEAEAVNTLEDVSVIAQRILQDVSLPVLVKTKVRPKGGWTAPAIVLAILLSPLWLVLACVCFAVLIAVFSVLISLAATVIALTAAFVAAGLALVLSIFLIHPVGAPVVLAAAAAGFMLLALGALSVLASKYVFKGIGWLVKLISRSIKSIFIRKDIQNEQVQ